jgi:hypothetical protein
VSLRFEVVNVGTPDPADTSHFELFVTNTTGSGTAPVWRDQPDMDELHTVAKAAGTESWAAAVWREVGEMLGIGPLANATMPAPTAAMERIAGLLFERPRVVWV